MRNEYKILSYSRYHCLYSALSRSYKCLLNELEKSSGQMSSVATPTKSRVCINEKINTLNGSLLYSKIVISQLLYSQHYISVKEKSIFKISLVKKRPFQPRIHVAMSSNLHTPMNQQSQQGQKCIHYVTMSRCYHKDACIFSIKCTRLSQSIL